MQSSTNSKKRGNHTIEDHSTSMKKSRSQFYHPHSQQSDTSIKDREEQFGSSPELTSSDIREFDPACKPSTARNGQVGNDEQCSQDTEYFKSPVSFEELNDLERSMEDSRQAHKEPEENELEIQLRQRESDRTDPLLSGQPLLRRIYRPWLDAVAGIEKDISIIRCLAEQNPIAVDPKCRKVLAKLDDFLLANRIVPHFVPRSHGVFEKPTPFQFSETGRLPFRTLWRRSISDSGCYPSRYELKCGLARPQKRGVYLQEVFQFHKFSNGLYSIEKAGCYVGSGISTNGGMLVRAVEHNDSKYRKCELNKRLYRFMGKGDEERIQWRAYRLAEWPEKTDVEDIYQIYGEILITEALWQMKLATGHKDEMTALMRKLQEASHKGNAIQQQYEGLNVKSALEPSDKPTSKGPPWKLEPGYLSSANELPPSFINIVSKQFRRVKAWPAPTQSTDSKGSRST